MKNTRSKRRKTPSDEMSTTNAMYSVSAPERSERPRTRPENLRARRRADDEMSTTGALSSVLAPETSVRPSARPAKKFKDGGMVRGSKPSQTSGTKFSGTF